MSEFTAPTEQTAHKKRLCNPPVVMYIEMAEREIELGNLSDDEVRKLIAADEASIAVYQAVLAASLERAGKPSPSPGA